MSVTVHGRCSLEALAYRTWPGGALHRQVRNVSSCVWLPICGNSATFSLFCIAKMVDLLECLGGQIKFMIPLFHHVEPYTNDPETA